MKKSDKSVKSRVGTVLACNESKEGGMKGDKETKLTHCAAADCIDVGTFRCRIRSFSFESRTFIDNSHDHRRVDRTGIGAVVGGDAGGDRGKGGEIHASHPHSHHGRNPDRDMDDFGNDPDDDLLRDPFHQS